MYVDAENLLSPIKMIDYISKNFQFLTGRLNKLTNEKEEIQMQLYVYTKFEYRILSQYYQTKHHI